MENDVRDALVSSLRGHEGEVLKVYDDATGKTINRGDVVKGFLTIGVGRNLMGRGITASESRYLLDNDLTAVETELDSLLPIWRGFAPARQAALLELCFNMGASNFIRGWPNTTQAIQRQDWTNVADRLRLSKWRTQVGTTRSNAIIRLIQTGRFS